MAKQEPRGAVAQSPQARQGSQASKPASGGPASTPAATTPTSTPTPPSGMLSIHTKSPKTKRESSFDRDLGTTLADTVTLFGEDVVHGMATAQIEIRIQGAVRVILNDEKKSIEESIVAGQDYSPGAPRKGGGGRKADPMARLIAKVKANEMTKQELLDLVAKQLDELS